MQNAKSNISSEFTLQELGDVLKELKRGKWCMDPAGFKGEMFISGGQTLTQSLAMASSIKNKAKHTITVESDVHPNSEKEKWFSAELI